jgi:hypothetical protein
MQVNTQAFLDSSQYFHMIWSAPFEIILVFIVLWFYIGPSMFAGLAFLVLLSPYSVYLTSRANKVETENIKIKDSRVKMMNEILSGIKVLRFYGDFCFPLNLYIIITIPFDT